MKKISTFFTREKEGKVPSNAISPSLESSTEPELANQSGEGIKKSENKIKSLFTRHSSSRHTALAYSKVCSKCHSNYRSCTCSKCFLCSSIIVLYKNMRHCSRCWQPVCADCASCTDSIAIRSLEDEKEVEMPLCDLCAAHESLRTIAREEAFSLIFPAFHSDSSDFKEEKKDEASKRKPLQHVSIHFSWGLYALLSSITPPKICANPICVRSWTYQEWCSKCDVPTFPSSIFCGEEKWRVAFLSEPTPPEAKVLDLSIIIPYDQQRRMTQKRCIAMLKTSDAECYAAHAFPYLFGSVPKDVFFSSSRPPQVVQLSSIEESTAYDSFTFSPSSVSTSITMMTLLSSVAVEVAEVPTVVSGSRINTSDHPLAPLLALRASENTHCELDYAGGSVAYFAFRTGDYSSVFSHMQSSMVDRGVWVKRKPEDELEDNNGKTETSSTQLLDDCIGFFSVNSTTVQENGTEELRFKIFALQYLFEQLESPEVARIRNDLITLRKAGVHIVLCGHGLGGALATLVTLQLIIEHTRLMCPSEEEKGIHCFTFGAPALIGGIECVQFMEDHNLTSCFHHYVYRSDLAPRLHCLDTYLDGDNVTEKLRCPISEQAKVQLQKMFWEWMHAQQPYTVPSIPQLKQLSSSTDRKNEKKKEESSSSKKEIRRISAADTHDSSKVASDPWSDRMKWNGNGDVFFEQREPFDTVYSCSSSTSQGAHSSHSGRKKTDGNESGKNKFPILSSFTMLFQVSDPLPFGCYHFLSLDPEKSYQFCHSKDDSVREILLNRGHLRVLFSDHCIPKYSKAILEYINSSSVSFQ